MPDDDAQPMPWWMAILIAVALLSLTALGAMMFGTVSPLRLASAQLVAGIVTVALFRKRAPFSLLPIGVGTMALLLVTGVALQFVMAELGNRISVYVPRDPDLLIRLHGWINSDEPWTVLSTFVAVVVVAPLVEELIFRGMILRGLQRRYGALVAWVGSAVLFGLVHVDPTAMIYATFGGLALGAAALWTGSTMAPLVLHIAINATAVLLPERLVQIPGFNTLEPGYIDKYLAAGACLVATCGLWLIRRRSLGSASA